MTFEDFDRLLLLMYEREKEMGKTKGVEYTQDADRLDNFKRIAKELGVSSKKVLWVYLKKHLDAIARYIKDDVVLSESIDSRILDARVYLSLLQGLIEEEKREVGK